MADPVALAREWLIGAAGDEEVAERALGPGRSWPALSAIHFQQSVEKLLKAFLTYHGRPFERTHDLGRLCQACVLEHADFAELIEVVDRLTDYAVDQRYPGIEPPTMTDVHEARLILTRVKDLVLKQLPHEVTSRMQQSQGEQHS